jgi:hypothetical protein
MAVEAEPPRDGETEDMLPARGPQSPPTIHRVSRRPLGIAPVALIGAALTAVVILAIILLALGSWVAGIILLASSLLLLALLLVALEWEPEDPAARLVVTAADRARSRTRLISVAARAWSRAGLAVMRIRQRRYQLRWQLRRELEPLGEAALRGEQERAERLKARAREIDQAIREADRARAEAVGAARAEIERERATSDATQAIPVHPDGIDA